MMGWELAVLILVAVAALLTAKYLPRPPSQSAEALPKSRSARGEIDGAHHEKEIDYLEN